MAEIVVPVLHFLKPDGNLDIARTTDYAHAAAATWVDKFIVAGSTARGRQLMVAQRAELLSLWLTVTGRDRLLGCMWQQEDREALETLGVTAMAVMEGIADTSAAMSFLASLPQRATIYSHPMFGGAVFDASLAAAARAEQVLPAGGKLAKVTGSGIAAIRASAGEEFQLWDGSCRHIAQSVAAGADGVVATPLCGFAKDFPERDLAHLQPYVAKVQASLDELPDRAARTNWLLAGV